MHFTDPLSLEETLAPVVGEVRIRPMTGSRFSAGIDVRCLQRVGLFTVKADSFFAQKSPQQEFYSLNVPLNAPFTVSESGNDETYGHADAYMWSTGRPFTFKCKDKCYAMACNIFVDAMEAYRERMLQETNSSEQILEPHVSLMSTIGNRMFRSVARVWVALGEGGSPTSEIALREMEDELLASFLTIAESPPATKERAVLPSDRALKSIEDYICANLDAAITRDDLVDVTGVPIRSLSRAFEKKYGLGPMAFVRQRRLDACYRYLHGSDREATTVTKVATSHGFDHLGKFSVVFKNTFGESPSETLLK